MGVGGQRHAPGRFIPEEDTVPIVGPRDGLDGCGKSHPTGIRSPDRPSRSYSLYRLSYTVPTL